MATAATDTKCRKPASALHELDDGDRVLCCDTGEFLPRDQIRSVCRERHKKEEGSYEDSFEYPKAKLEQNDWI